jgi:outer membrane protein assembly factor BamB
LTYHYNNQRTGWNPNEALLTPSNVPSLQLLASVPLDDQVDAQPLLFNGVVYVVTENNSVYAINASSGNLIASRTLG